MFGGTGVSQRLRRRRRTYTRLLEATVGLIDASTACGPRLSRSGRIVIGAAILRVCEADGAARYALLRAEPRRLEEAAAGLDLARATLADAGRDASFDAARRRSISLVAAHDS
jgi:hypothetical protein